MASAASYLESPAPSFLFDLDGTLIDSVYQHVIAWRAALMRIGIELSVWRIHRRIGMSGGLFVTALLRGRIAAYNMHLRGIADEHGCDLVDLWSMRALKDTRAWSPDRLHLTTEGHRQVARRACEVLGIPADEDWRVPPPGQSPPVRPPAARAGRSPWLTARRQDARWAREYAGPWLRRRLGGTSSGDGVLPKRPDLLPL